VNTVDRGAFPIASIREKHPLPEPTRVTTAVDARRLRALVIDRLEAVAAAGDTLRPRDAIISALRQGTDTDDATQVTEDVLAVAEEEQFAEEIRLVKMGDGRIAYQLGRLAEVGAKIRELVAKRTGAKAKPIEVEADWHKLLAQILGPIADGPDREAEGQAREEKAAALVELAHSRFSVLIGPAGT